MPETVVGGAHPQIIKTREPGKFSREAEVVIGLLFIFIVTFAFLTLHYRDAYLVARQQLLPHPQSFTLFFQSEVLGRISTYASRRFLVPPNSTNASISGAYSAIPTGRYIVGAIMSPALFENFTANSSSINTALYFFGLHHNTTINQVLVPGTYYLVFYNPNQTAQVGVYVTSPILLRYTSNSMLFQ